LTQDGLVAMLSGTAANGENGLSRDSGNPV